jgi:hypothetical protein
MKKLVLCLTDEGLKYLDVLIQLGRIDEDMELPEKDLLAYIQEELSYIEAGTNIYQWADAITNDPDGLQTDIKVFINMLLSGYIGVAMFDEDESVMTEGFHGPFKLER